MAKNKPRKRNGFSTQKIFKYVRIAALALPAAVRIMEPGTPAAKMNRLSMDYFAFNPANGIFNLSWAVRGWAPFITATAFTYGVPKLAGMIRGL